MKKKVKEYNARGERMYKNLINRENAKKNKKNKIKQDEKYKKSGSGGYFPKLPVSGSKENCRTRKAEN